MLNFRSYLTEARAAGVLEDGPLTHLYHTSSLGHLAGHAGTEHAIGALNTLYSHVAKGKLPKELSVKVDGAPAVIISGPSAKNPMGTVSTKSAFNANPKINATHEDIDRNHGDKLGLADKLKDVLDHAHNIIPSGMTVQGDVIHGGAKDVHTQEIDGVPHRVFKANLLRYAVPADSEEAQKIDSSKVGLALHTIYDEHGRARPLTQEETARLGSHPDVHVMSVFPSQTPEIDNQRAAKIQGHLQNASSIHDNMKNNGSYDVIHPHGNMLEMYINHSVRSGEPQSLGGYQKWLTDRTEREATKLKTQAAQDRKRAENQGKIAYIRKNKGHFTDALNLQKELESATSHLSDSLTYTHGYRSFIGDQETGPEGHVYNYKGKSVKIVRRRPEEGSTGVAFSQANLQKGGVGK